MFWEWTAVWLIKKMTWLKKMFTRLGISEWRIEATQTPNVSLKKKGSFVNYVGRYLITLLSV